VGGHHISVPHAARLLPAESAASMPAQPTCSQGCHKERRCCGARPANPPTGAQMLCRSCAEAAHLPPRTPAPACGSSSALPRLGWAPRGRPACSRGGGSGSDGGSGRRQLRSSALPQSALELTRSHPEVAAVPMRASPVPPAALHRQLPLPAIPSPPPHTNRLRLPHLFPARLTTTLPPTSASITQPGKGPLQGSKHWECVCLSESECVCGQGGGIQAGGEKARSCGRLASDAGQLPGSALPAAQSLPHKGGGRWCESGGCGKCPPASRTPHLSWLPDRSSESGTASPLTSVKPPPPANSPSRCNSPGMVPAGVSRAWSLPCLHRVCQSQGGRHDGQEAGERQRATGYEVLL
jgi:hypothetical protein